MDNSKNLVKALRSIFNEADLYEIISSEIKIADKNHNHSIKEKSNFSKEELIHIRDNLRKFIELNDELSDVVDLEHLYFLLDELTSIRAVLKDYAVSKRIEKEIRELNLKVPSYVERKQTERNYELNSRFANLEKNSPKCAYGHDMVIRQGGANSYFWGCNRFPECFSTKQISSLA
jgi:hypothetical protein